ncbi:MAG TPA: amino acid adenylation domain-containing protein, partial [Verrucomicrobiae bacterium]|nr:amino acid adenylation domain-containing protein [Verrucomicrobiae bacterium]
MAGEFPARNGSSIPVRNSNLAPLSFSQERLWFLDQLQPNSSLYVMPVAFQLAGPLHPAALETVLGQVIARHHILRTSFVSMNGSPVQVIGPATEFKLQVVDLAGRSAEEMPQRLIAEAERPFDLARDLMLRATLFRLGANKHVLLLNMHHIASDAWSWSIFLRELSELYRAAVAGEKPSLPMLPIQYADYANWEREQFQNGKLEEELAYWRQQLQGAPVLLELPADHSRPATQSFRGGCCSISLTQELHERLKIIARREGVTLYLLLLTAFKVLVHRYTGREDLVIGTPIAGRSETETESLIGFFVRTLALRTDLSGNPIFRELLERVKQVVFDAHAHQDLPFEKIVEELRPVRSPGFPPLVQVMFAFQNTPAWQLELAGLSTSDLELPRRTAKFDLTLFVDETEGELRLTAEYNLELFAAATVQRFLHHFEILLEGISANLDRKISELPLLASSERKELLEHWSHATADYPRDATISKLFEEQVSRIPDAIAIEHQHTQLSYQAFNERANQLAHHLQSLGVGVDGFVAVAMARSPELIIALLAILKSGAAYVALDVAQPDERLSLMLEDAPPRVLLTETTFKDRFSAARTDATVICVDKLRTQLTRASVTNPTNQAAATNLAYVSFTSGSTGRPKGVCVPHRGVVRLVRNADYLQLNEADVVAQISNCAFDASTFEIWGALLNGACLSIFPQGVVLSPKRFKAELERTRVTALFVTTALFNQLTQEEPEIFAGVKNVLFGGDAVNPRRVAEVLKRGRPARLLHVYGPTESTTYTTWHEVSEVRDGDTSVPIGRPIANTEVFVLDQNLQPVPIGVGGELYVGGDGLATGYLNRPELTAMKFVPHPFSAAPGARLYRTGDIVRYRADGNLEFIGRLDSQIKLRGFRVELAEIEAVISRHPAIADCAVAVDGKAPGEKRLVAYVVSNPSPGLSEDELRMFLRTKLPDYMLPGVFVFVPAMPLNANGKIDRTALLALDTGTPRPSRQFVAPRDATETQLGQIWQDLLHIKPVGATDNFFDLGGHSLLAIRLLARVEKELGKSLPVATLFQSPTLGEFARAIKTAGKTMLSEGHCLVPIQPNGAKPPLFLVHGAGGGMFWGYTNLARHLGADQPVYAFRSRGLDGLTEFNSIQEMAAAYITSLRAFQPKGPYCLGGYCFGGNVAYEMACQLRDAGKRVSVLALMNSTPPDSGYREVTFSPGWLRQFLANVVVLLKWHFGRTRDQRRDYLKWQSNTIRGKLRKFFRGEISRQISAGELVDLSACTSDERAAWDAHVEALFNHRTRSYDGEVTLLRSRGHQFWCSFDPAYGWRGFVKGNLKIQIIDGAHEQILEEPFVPTLAGKLKRALNRSKGVEASASSMSEPALRPTANGHTRNIVPPREWNETQVAFPVNQTYAQAFETQARQTPNALAVRSGETELTYAELNRRANQLAHCLMGAGVGPETLVAVCLERSPDLLVALLAVFKSGGAYVPLDPNYPKERLQFMLSDSAARLLVTHSSLAAEFATSTAPSICLDDIELQNRLNRCPDDNPAPRANADNLAYVIYTSGSTGTPKGVQITHRSLLNHNFAVRDLYRLRDDDRVLQFSPFSFDISVEEIFPSWLAGSAVVLRTDDALTSIERFFQFVAQERLTVLNLPTAYWHELVDALTAHPLPEKIRLVVIGGERASEVRYQSWKERVGERVTLINTYGPTEATVIATTFTAGKDDNGTLPIGRPIANAEVLILDASLNEVPVGETGELYIGGAGVARGYRNRAELTAEKFIPHPTKTSERLYRTGDLARWRPDGNVEFVGREDQQIKIRGYRVELPEIEAALLEHPGVKDAVVTVREDAPGQKRLAAYCVSRTPGSASDLREYLKQKLPSHMIPAAFVLLESLPLSPGGKVDRRALPEPGPERPELGVEFVAPRTPVEEVLAKIWGEVLEVNPVGVQDDFFDLGGHSLLAARVLSRIRAQLEVEIPLSGLFNNPTVAALAEYMTCARTPAQPVLPIAEVSTTERLPLTAAQQRLWFLDRFEPEQSQYNIPIALRLSGLLDVTALEESLTALSHRHPALRAVFPVEEGSPIQCICPPQAVPLPRTDLRNEAKEHRWSRALELLRSEARNPYVFAHPLLRALLLQLDDEEHVLLLIVHQLAADGRSLRILLKELPVLYEASAMHREPTLPTLPLDYAAVVNGGHLPLQQEKKQLDYWLKQLRDVPAILELPADRPRPNHKSDAGARHGLELPVGLVGALEELSQQECTTLFATLLAAFEVLLARYAGCTELVIGSTVPRENSSEHENIVGQFENLLVLRGNLSGDPTFREFLRRTSVTIADAWANRALPFTRILNALQPERDPRRHPVFQVLFQFEEEALPTALAANVRFIPEEIDNHTAKLMLTLRLVRSRAGVAGWIEYSTDLFEAARIARMAEHFQVLLQGIAALPDERLWALPLLREEERRQLLEDWNQTALDYPQTASLTALFEEQVQRTPDAPALIAGHEELNYRELNARANQLAHYLGAAGMPAETLVGLCVERGWQMVVGILGILKAGGAYVPMDPSYPKERLEFMLADADASLLVTEQKLLALFPSATETTASRKIVCLDADWEFIAASSRSNPEQKARPENLAYVIYTSGSTGKPKGVAIEHRAPVALLHWARETFSREAIAGVLGATSMCFDLSIFEMFVPLSWGGTLILADNAIGLAGLPAANKVTLVNTVPSAMRELLRVKGVPASVRVVNLAGEPLTTELADQIYNETSVEKVYDLYGPTETTTYSTGTLRKKGDAPTIGRPLANEQVYILDARRQPQPVGVPGELYIGGDGLARGYLHRPELTAERFVPHPFREGARLYKTGDLARWRADGNLEFLGRMDHQVKIRGFRIELGEIESALRQHPEIAEAIALAQEGHGEDKQLVAYLVVRPASHLSVGTLREFLRGRLPEYMVPAHIIFLEAMPLTPNGKVDRKSLPRVQPARLSENECVMPRTPVETSLVAIWREVLGVDQVGVHDNFFELGGHSLLAIQVVSRIRAELHFEVPLHALFDRPTIAALAAGMAGGELIPESASALPLRRVSREGVLPVSFVQERLWVLAQLEPESSAYHVPVALRLKGVLNVPALEHGLAELVRRHEALRTEFRMEGENVVQVIQPPSRLPITRLDVRTQPEEAREGEARRLVAAAVRKPFDLAKGPLVRAVLVQLGERDHVLGLVMHHTICDGWSLAVFFKELETFYNAHQSGLLAPRLPELPIQCVDHAQWQRQRFQGETLNSELEWWKRTLAGAPSSVQLPHDAITKAPGPDGAQVSVTLPEQFGATLNRFCQKHQSTPFMTCLTALAITLKQWTQQNDLVLGTVVAGRNSRELESVMGCFMNFLPLRIKLDGVPTARELLAQTRAVVLNAQAHQECPFQKIVEAVNPKRQRDQNPLYNVALLLQNFPTKLFYGENVDSRLLVLETETALLDLRFEVEESEGGLSIRCEYKTSLFTADTAAHLLAAYRQVLETLVALPETELSKFPVAAELTRKGEPIVNSPDTETVAVTATFTAEFLAEPFRFWMKELELDATMEFAPYGQVFQELLEANRLLPRNQSGLNVVLVRLEDWEHAAGSENGAAIARKLEDLELAFKGASSRSAVPYLVCFCPSRDAARFEQLENECAAALRPVNNVYVVTTAEL